MLHYGKSILLISRGTFWPILNQRAVRCLIVYLISMFADKITGNVVRSPWWPGFSLPAPPSRDALSVTLTACSKREILRQFQNIVDRQCKGGLNDRLPAGSVNTSELNTDACSRKPSNHCVSNWTKSSLQVAN